VALMLLSVAVVSVIGTYALSTPLQSFATQSTEDATFIVGHLEVVLRDQDGNIKAYSQGDNNIVEDGMEILVAETFLSLQGGISSIGPVSHIEVGTDGTTAPGPADIALSTKIGTGGTFCNRVATVNTAPSAASNDATNASVVVTVTATIDAAADNDCAVVGIDEAGLFNDGTESTGKMFARNTFTAVTLTTSDSLDLTWAFTFTDS